MSVAARFTGAFGVSTRRVTPPSSHIHAADGPDVAMPPAPGWPRRRSASSHPARRSTSKDKHDLRAVRVGQGNRHRKCRGRIEGDAGLGERHRRAAKIRRSERWCGSSPSASLIARKTGRASRRSGRLTRVGKGCYRSRDPASGPRRPCCRRCRRCAGCGDRGGLPEQQMAYPPEGNP